MYTSLTESWRHSIQPTPWTIVERIGVYDVTWNRISWCLALKLATRKRRRWLEWARMCRNCVPGTHEFFKERFRTSDWVTSPQSRDRDPSSFVGPHHRELLGPQIYTLTTGYAYLLSRCLHDSWSGALYNGHILYFIENKRYNWSKIAIFSYPCIRSLSEYCHNVWYGKLE